ncbi:MAG: exonuclease sbcCD subunit D [Cellulomonas sp. 73-92]|mgnify:CR=1 FL=1|uniref:exonuclease SbcCD subunit D n=1 Tax=Cellulomonas sp. 73-92 TaxID=1895740 RepID=UPI000929D3C2|nr:exonuclease SbcCD subunit D [Cellulomonas sp. 73-92]OJV80999.1 MAG: exonuclease sbcCD subunit D [Cellulomonas sp. 73-92]
MRLLHTSDWHLGRTLHGVDLLEHQAAYLDHLVELARAERVDAVLVAGDVYDRAIPSVEAVAVLSDALARLSESTTVVLTSGNHDSSTRLGFGAALMRDRLRLRTSVAGLASPVVVGDTLVYGLPYLDPDFARAQLADDDGLLARSHEAVLAAAMRRVRADRATRAERHAVVMAHAFVTGGQPSESERDIRVGGVDQVPAGVFAGADYVALGHLHGPQQVAPGVRYSGSPLAYSFGEQHQHKSTALVDLGPDELRVTLVPAPVPRALADVTGTLDELLASPAHTADWVRVTVTDAARPPDLQQRVRAHFPHALVVLHAPAGGGAGTSRAVVVGAASDPLQVAAQFVLHVTGAGPAPAEAAVLRRAYEDVVGAERSA